MERQGRGAHHSARRHGTRHDAIVSAESKLAPYPLDVYAIADYANAVRENIDQTDDAGDAGTADLFTEISRGIDKQLWFLEAHVQEPMGLMRDGGSK